MLQLYNTLNNISYTLDIYSKDKTVKLYMSLDNSSSKKTILTKLLLSKSIQPVLYVMDTSFRAIGVSKS